jgi:hypothetical protein
MTSISQISSNNGIQQLSQISQRGMRPPEGDQQEKDGGGLLGAIDAALKSAGIEGGLQAIFGQSSATSASSDSGSATDSTDTSQITDPASSLNAFLQQLMSALQAQGTTDSDTTENTDNNELALQGMSPPPPHGYGGQGMEDKLQNLISSLSSTSSDNTSADSDSGNSNGLESSFQ